MRFYFIDYIALLPDLPCIVSADHFGMFDPHNIYFQTSIGKSTGKRWNLTPDTEARLPVGHTMPFLGVCDCNESVFAEGSYPGTLFRFPLRQTPSQLSSTIYDHGKVVRLFKSFMYEAHLLLLFLKNVVRIELCTKTKESQETQFLVHIVPECLAEIKEKRKIFADKIKKNTLNKQIGDEPIHINYLLTVETRNYTSENQSKCCLYKWLVTEYCAGGQISKQFHDLCIDPKLGYVPLVGIAMDISNNIAQIHPVDETQKTEKTCEMAHCIELSTEELIEGNANSTIGMPGQVFCFLPLPMEQKSASGLPVHVNGYFALGQDRGHLKWATGDPNEAQLDQSVLWNQCLLNELLPAAYDMTILVAINEHKMQRIRLEHVLGALPNIALVNEKWQPLVEHLYQSVLQKEVFYTEAEHGRWVTAQDSLFDCALVEPEETVSLLRSLLLCAKENIVNCSNFVWKMLVQYPPVRLQSVSPQLIRDILRKKPQLIDSWNSQQKSMLLR